MNGLGIPGAPVEKHTLFVTFATVKKIAFLFIALCLQAAAQTRTQTFRGSVLDADSKSPIPMAFVLLTGSDTAFKTSGNEDGVFRIEKVPVGRYTLKVVSTGFEPTVLSNIIVTSGKEVVMTVELHEKIVNKQQVEIVLERDKTKANNDLVTNSSRNFLSEETDRYAGSRGDPSKMVSAYAGVATGNDARNDIIVRGNSPLGVLWRLEGVDIPNPNHFASQGATGGPVSILNNNLLDASDFLTGAFPAEYGNKMAAVFDIHLRKGNNEKREYTAQVGFNGLEFGAEGPFNKKNGSSYLINYRYSTLELFKLAGISFGVSAIPKYTDLCMKYYFPTKKGSIALWGIGGVSIISLLDSEKDSTDWQFTDKGEDLVFGSKMGAAGITHTHFFNDKVSGKTSISFSGTRFTIDLDTLSKTKAPFRSFQNHSDDHNITASYYLTDKISAHHLLKAGAIYKQMYFDYHSFYYDRDYKHYVDQLKETDNAGLAEVFLHWQFRATDKLTLNNGLCYQNFLLNNTSSLEPRTGIRWQFLPKHSLSAAVGMHSQTSPLIYYFLQTYDSATAVYTRTNKDLDLQRSVHYVLGYDFNFAKDYRLKVEGYYQSLYNIPVERTSSSFSLVNVGNDLEGLPLKDSLINKGTGMNYGTELTFEKFFSKGFYFLNSLSLYQSKYKGSDGILHSSAFSGDYVWNILGGIEIPVGKKNKFIAFDVRATFAGGNRYTPIDLARSDSLKQTVYVDSLAWSKKFSDYQKIDFKVSYRINSKKASHYIFVHIENIFNHKNILRQIYDSSKQQIITEYQLGLFPYGGYRVEF